MDQDAAKAKTQLMLNDLWRRQLPTIREHLALLSRTAERIHSSALTAPLRSEAAISAHKLAGSLGMFGYPEGTRLARELEHLLDADDVPPPETFSTLVRNLRESVPA